MFLNLILVFRLTVSPDCPIIKNIVDRNKQITLIVKFYYGEDTYSDSKEYQEVQK